MQATYATNGLSPVSPRNFGKGTGFALGLIFLGGIFIPILAWGDAQDEPQSS